MKMFLFIFIFCLATSCIYANEKIDFPKKEGISLFKTNKQSNLSKFKNEINEKIMAYKGVMIAGIIVSSIANFSFLVVPFIIFTPFFWYILIYLTVSAALCNIAGLILFIVGCAGLTSLSHKLKSNVSIDDRNNNLTLALSYKL